MADFPVYAGQISDTIGADTTDSAGTTVTGSATNNTKGSWAELIASTTRDTRAILLNVGQYSGTTVHSALLDLGIGAASSEQVIVSNLLVHGGGGGRSMPRLFFLPLSIPVGTRVSARMQSTDGAQAVDVTAMLLAYGMPGMPQMGRSTTYGAVTSDSGGSEINPDPTTVNTKGVYKELDASTANRIRWLIVNTGQRNTATGDVQWLIDVGVGAATSEQIVIANLHARSTTTQDVIGPVTIGPFPVLIPSGSRLAARAQATVTGSGRLLDVIVYGFD